MDLAALGERAARERLRSYGDLVGIVDGVETRYGEGWLAVRTGADSNDLNGVLTDAAWRPDRRLFEDLSAWMSGLPACWHVARADPEVTRVLVDAGLRPERTGYWCGRGLTDERPSPDVERVTEPEDVHDWLTVLEACDWLTGSEDRTRRASLALAQLGDPRQALWVVRRDGAAVGAAAGWYGAAFELTTLAVRADHRRTGLGTELARAALAWAVAAGATAVVAAASPDGWRLLRTLGFASAPVTPDVCFYLG